MRVSHASVRCLALVCLCCVLFACTPRLPASPLGPIHPEPLRPVTEYLALVAGCAAILVAVVFAFLREYAAGITASLGCAGLCALFLVLPAVVSFIKWAVLASLVLAVGGACYLAVTRIRHTDAPLPKLWAKLRRPPPTMPADKGNDASLDAQMVALAIGMNQNSGST